MDIKGFDKLCEIAQGIKVTKDAKKPIIISK